MKKKSRYPWAMLGAFLLLMFMTFALRQSRSQAQELSPAEPSGIALIELLNRETQGPVRISYHVETGKVRFIGAAVEQAIAQPATLGVNASPEAAARGFLAQYGSLFGLVEPDKELEVMRERVLDDGRSFVRFQQTYQEIPIVGGELIVQMNPNQDVISTNGEILPDLDINIAPSISAETARQTALTKVAKDYGLDEADLEASAPELWIYNPTLLGGPGVRFNALVWRTEVTPRELAPIREFVLIDAHLGAVALSFNQTDTAKNRNTYDANNTTSLPGTLVCNESNPTCSGGDSHEVAAHVFAGDTYDFFMNEHGRDSIDNAGMTLISTVHYGSGFANAFWNGIQMVYGDAAAYPLGDDVVGHELTHGVTENESNLFYYYQSGAINESFSDVWGEFVDQYQATGNDAGDTRWEIGEDITGLGAIRNMQYPTLFGSPDRMTSPFYYCAQAEFYGPIGNGSGDNGGVHYNSGVNNKAAYLMTDGDTFNGQTVTGLGYAKVADLYYEVQTGLLTSAADYADLYDALIQASINLGFSAADQQEVQDALLAVEMNEDPTSCPAPEALICDSGSPTNLFFDDIESGSGNWTAGSNTGTLYWFVPQTTSTIGFADPYAASGVGNIWGLAQGSPFGGPSDTFLAMNSDVMLPANAYMHFNHSFGFESSVPSGSSRYDGSLLEYSTNGGSSWNNAGSLITHNGYNGTLEATNPFGAIPAFTADSRGYISSRLDLNSLAGQNVRFRFRIGTDEAVFDYGWFVDDVRIYTCGAGGNTAPTISGLPDQTVAVDGSKDNAIDLWSYANDVEDTDSALTFTITNSPAISAGVTLDSNRYIDINPAAGWSGSTNVTIEIEDSGGLTDSDTFQVTVVDEYKIYLPVILNCYPLTPVLNSIQNSDNDGVYTVNWSWPSCSSSSPSYYELQADENPQFSSPDTFTEGDTSFEAYSPTAATYYWRVRAYLSGTGYSEWGNTQSVTVNSFAYVWVDNDTGGNLTVEIVGVETKAFSTGLYYWRSITPGSYTYKAWARCGSGSWTENFAAGERLLSFLCSSSAVTDAFQTSFDSNVTKNRFSVHDLNALSFQMYDH